MLNHCELSTAFRDDCLTKSISFKRKKVWRRSHGKYSFVNSQQPFNNDTASLKGK